MNITITERAILVIDGTEVSTFTTDTTPKNERLKNILVKYQDTILEEVFEYLTKNRNYTLRKMRGRRSISGGKGTIFQPWIVRKHGKVKAVHQTNNNNNNNMTTKVKHHN